MKVFYWCLGVFLVTGIFLIPVAVRAEIPQEEMEKLKDYGTALKDTITETKDYLKDVSDKWTWVKDKYGGHPKIVGYIDKLNDSGLTKHLNNSISVLGKYEAGIKKITNIKANIDAINGFYDRYKPDKNNPLRSLQQMSNILEDLNSAIEKLDPSGGVLTKPFREIIAFYQQAASGFSNALGRLNKKIKERGGGGIGLGFTATTDKEKKFIKKFADQTVFPWPWIKYIRPGSSQAEEIGRAHV